MSKRSDRREAERVARKLAYQVRQITKTAAAEPAEANTFETEAPTFQSAPEAPEPQPAISQARLAANRANAQLSSGPATSEGRAVASKNALKTGLTGRTVLLPTDDPAEFERRLHLAFQQHRPVNEEEQELIKSIVEIDWRLNRIIGLETGIFNKGYDEFADQFKDQPLPQRNSQIHTETYLKYEKSLRNIYVQESRLQRQRIKILADLKRLRDDRASQALAEHFAPPLPANNGFEFSTPEFASAQHSPAVGAPSIHTQNHRVART